MTERYVGTGEAADALGIDRTTLARWVKRYNLKPADRTLGGYLRWDLDDLRRQIKAIREREERET